MPHLKNKKSVMWLSLSEEVREGEEEMEAQGKAGTRVKVPRPGNLKFRFFGAVTGYSDSDRRILHKCKFIA